MIYDVSMLIHEDMQVYKNKEEKRPVIENVSNHKDGHAHESKIIMNLHTGTHIDFPLHMIEQGKTSDSEVINKFLTTCKVLDMTDLTSHVDGKSLSKYQIEEGDFILLKTKNSFSDAFISDFIYLNEDGAKFLLEKKVKGVGIDGLGIERNQEGHPTHKILLGHDIPIIEGLRLKDIKEASYEMICLPLKIKHVEALPARIILKDLT